MKNSVKKSIQLPAAAAAALMLSLVAGSLAHAQSGPTPQEQMACRSDAGKFCAEAVGWLPQGGGIARRVTDDGTACTASCPQSRSSERWSGMTNQRKVITLQARIVKGSINHPDRTA
jgi:hypothetical protein